ncbi:MAG TPA: serine hydrolase [Acidobacteriota bacterium]|nr:serine hydrolase [Acidobacteriota bacterium]
MSATLLVQAASPSQEWPIPEWTAASPQSQGLDGERLGAFVEGLRQGLHFPDVHSLLIVRNGYLVVEEYFGGWNRERLHEQQSVSKSFTSAIIGLALQRGDLESLDQKIVDFFPEYEIENRDARKESMTLRDLLTMRSGTDYHERGYQGSPHAQLNSLSRGWDRFVLNRPMLRQPGTHFQYDSGGVILLSAILKQVTGLHADQYADRYFFPKIGIENTRWFRNAEGHPHTGGGLSLRPVDMARLGLLYLRGGRWGSEQVLDAEWIESSLTQQVSLNRPNTIGYGYLWWALRPPEEGGQTIWAAMGYKGQHIFLIPDYDMIVVTSAGNLTSTMHAPVDLLYSQILPTVRSRSSR